MGARIDFHLPTKEIFDEFEIHDEIRRTIKGIRLAANEKKIVNLKVRISKQAKTGTKYICNIIQKTDGIITGGYTYIIDVV